MKFTYENMKMCLTTSETPGAEIHLTVMQPPKGSSANFIIQNILNKTRQCLKEGTPAVYIV